MSKKHQTHSKPAQNSNHISLYLFSGSFVLILILIYFWPQQAKNKLPIVKAPASLIKQNEPVKPIPISETQPIQVKKQLYPQKAEKQKDVSFTYSKVSPINKSATPELPKELSLGEHTIQLKGGEWRLKLKLTLSSEQADFVRYASPLRRRLTQMMFFLVNHRVPEALRSIEGEERLRLDLYTRFQNVLKGQEFELFIDAFELEEIQFDEE